MKQSREIISQAIADYKPYAIVAMFSGGDDSLTALTVARTLGVQIDYILHAHTNTGIPDTLHYVRRYANDSGIAYIEESAGDVYEKYVLRKGFFGRGKIAHTYAYHLLKHQPFRSAVSKYIRKRKRGRNVLLINGAREGESDNRAEHTSAQVIRPDGPNIWVNIINHWTKAECRNFLHDKKIQRNPVTERLCRSGECMCGTMQSKEQRMEAAYWYPKWGAWVDELETRVQEKFPWGWGEEAPQYWKHIKAGQIPMDGFLPMCHGCTREVTA